MGISRWNITRFWWILHAESFCNCEYVMTNIRKFQILQSNMADWRSLTDAILQNCAFGHSSATGSLICMKFCSHNNGEVNKNITNSRLLKIFIFIFIYIAVFQSKINRFWFIFAHLNTLRLCKNYCYQNLKTPYLKIFFVHNSAANAIHV